MAMQSGESPTESSLVVRTFSSPAEEQLRVGVVNGHLVVYMLVHATMQCLLAACTGLSRTGI